MLFRVQVMRKFVSCVSPLYDVSRLHQYDAQVQNTYQHLIRHPRRRITPKFFKTCCGSRFNVYYGQVEPSNLKVWKLSILVIFSNLSIYIIYLQYIINIKVRQSTYILILNCFTKLLLYFTFIFFITLIQLLFFSLSTDTSLLNYKPNIII